MNAIEANDYKIELPLEMALAKGSIESGVTGISEPEVKYPKGKTPLNEVGPILVSLIFVGRP